MSRITRCGAGEFGHHLPAARKTDRHQEGQGQSSDRFRPNLFLPGSFSISTRIGRSVAPPRIRPSSDGGKQRHDGRAQAAIKRPVFMKIRCIVSESIQQADHGKHHPRLLPGKRRANRDAEDGSQDRSVQQNGHIHFEVPRCRSSGVPYRERRRSTLSYQSSSELTVKSLLRLTLHPNWPSRCRTWRKPPCPSPQSQRSREIRNVCQAAQLKQSGHLQRPALRPILSRQHLLLLRQHIACLPRHALSRVITLCASRRACGLRRRRV